MSKPRAHLPTLLLSIWLLNAPTSAIASDAVVFRCEQDGRTVYQQTGCADGQPVNVSDTRSKEQRHEAEQVVARQERSAQMLARDRSEALKRAPPAAAITLGKRVDPQPPEARPPKRQKVIRVRSKSKHRTVEPAQNLAGAQQPLPGKAPSR